MTTKSILIMGHGRESRTLAEVVRERAPFVGRSHLLYESTGARRMGEARPRWR